MSRDILTRPEERVQYELHRFVVEHLRSEPSTVIKVALSNLADVRRRARNPMAIRWLADWENALNGPLDGLIDLCLRQDEYGMNMRQIAPFAGVLTDEERLRAIRRAKDTGSRAEGARVSARDRARLANLAKAGPNHAAVGPRRR